LVVFQGLDDIRVGGRNVGIVGRPKSFIVKGRACGPNGLGVGDLVAVEFVRFPIVTFEELVVNVEVKENVGRGDGGFFGAGM